MNWMGEIMSWVKENWVAILAIWSGVCIIVDTITGLTATTADDTAWEKIKKVIVSIISLNPKK